MIGVFGKVVQIDESMMFKCKYGRLRYLSGQNVWVVGGIEDNIYP